MKKYPLNSMVLTSNFYSEIEAASAVFGQRLSARRKALQLSQRDLANKVGVSANTIQSYEAGCLPRGAHFLTLARVLGRSVNWLVCMNEAGEFCESADLSEAGAGGLINSMETSGGLDYFFKPPFFDQPDKEAAARREVGFSYRLLSEISSKPENTKMLVFKGPSMQPTLSDGDLVMVDVGRTEIHSGYLYLIKIDDTQSINRLIMKPRNCISIISDNKELCPPFDLPNNQLEVLGRIIWASKAL